MKKSNPMKRGFTLIEIVIVLAIAALIMVVVFLAVQGAQRSQRDQFRKETANRVLSAAQQFRGNNSGTAPTDASKLDSYVSANALHQIIANGVTATLATSVPAALPLCTIAATSTTADVTYVPAGTLALTTDTVYVCLESATGPYKVSS